MGAHKMPKDMGASLASFFEEERHRFGLIFTTADRAALEKVKAFIRANFQDATIIYAVGPTDRFLWILQGKLVGGAPDERG